MFVVCLVNGLSIAKFVQSFRIFSVPLPEISIETRTNYRRKMMLRVMRIDHPIKCGLKGTFFMYEC